MTMSTPRSSWTPQLQGDGPIYEQLVAALERDVASGALAPGERLPPHRELAYALKIGVGTVTKAYAEAERRGLVAGHVGRGSFIAAGVHGAFTLAPEASAGAIDLARNFPPFGPVQQRLRPAFARLQRRADLLEAFDYAPPDGPPAHRAAAADWLRRRHGLDVSGDDVVLCGGAQQATALALSVLCRPGDAVLCEAATFHGFKALAEHAGYRPVGVALDEEGLIPEALDRAAAASGARVLYAIPTLQNPTGAIMGETRRRRIVEIARARDLSVLEDDVYAPYARAEAEATPLRNLAPERVWHIASASKALTPGLRVGFLTPPEGGVRNRVLRAVRANYYAPPGLTSLVLAQWIEDGTADEIADEMIADTAQRNALALEVTGLGRSAAPCRYASHLWLPMSELEAERAAGRALRAGVEVTPPSAPVVDASLVSGLRLCLAAAGDLPTLERGLRVVMHALSPEADDSPSSVV